MTAQTMTAQWNASVHQAANGATAGGAWQRLQDDAAAVIVMKGLVHAAEYEPIVGEVERRHEEATVSRYSNGTLTTFGAYLARHLRTPATYFEAAAASSDLFGGGRPDLRAALRERLATCLGLAALDVAREPDGRVYAPAIVRIHANGVSNPLHNDNIARDGAGSGLIVANLTSQFSCITCLQECDGGGELLHYRRRWQPDDERFKVPNGLGYSMDVVSGAELCRFRPETGDVYVIDPTNYHAIEAVRGWNRITLGFFFGFFDCARSRGICWA